MEKIMPRHLVGFGSVKDYWEEDEYSFTDAGMTEPRFIQKVDTAACDKLCEELSGEVIITHKNNL